MTRRRRGRWSCCAEPEEIDDDEILRRINALYRGASLSQVLGEWKRLKVEEEKLLEHTRPTGR